MAPNLRSLSQQRWQDGRFRRCGRTEPHTSPVGQRPGATGTVQPARQATVSGSILERNFIILSMSILSIVFRIPIRWWRWCFEAPRIGPGQAEESPSTRRMVRTERTERRRRRYTQLRAPNQATGRSFLDSDESGNLGSGHAPRRVSSRSHSQLIGGRIGQSSADLGSVPPVATQQGSSVHWQRGPRHLDGVESHVSSRGDVVPQSPPFFSAKENVTRSRHRFVALLAVTWGHHQYVGKSGESWGIGL